MELLYFIVLATLLASWLVVRPTRYGFTALSTSGQLLAASMISLFDHQLTAYRFWSVARIALLVGALGLAVWAYASAPSSEPGSADRMTSLRARPVKRSLTSMPWGSRLVIASVAIVMVTLIVNLGLEGRDTGLWSVSGRWIATMTIGVLLAIRIPRSEGQRLLGELVGLYSVALLAALVLLPDQTFGPIRSPLFDHVLVIPHIGGRALPAIVGLATLVGGLSTTRKARYLALPTSAALLLASQVRGLIVAALSIILVWTLTLEKRARVITWLIMGLLFLGGLVGPGRTLWDREQAHPESANATSYRSAIFAEAIGNFKESPIIGQGLGVGDRDLLITIGKPGRKWATHSEAGTALAATGVLGGLAIATIYLTSFAACIRHVRRSQDWIPLAIITAMIVTIPVITWISRVSLLTLPFLFLVLPVVLSPTQELDQ